MKSHFQKLVKEAEPPRQKPTVSTGGLFVGLSTEPEIWGQKDNRFRLGGDDQSWQPEEPITTETPVDEDQILSELNLSDRLTIAELKAIRRNFARQNHPDTGSGESSVREERMKIANMIIDRQIQLRFQG